MRPSRASRRDELAVERTSDWRADRSRRMAPGRAIIQALSELARVLRPGGRALIDTDWDSIVWHSGDPQRMRRMLDAWGEHLIDPHLPRRLVRLLDGVGLTVEVCQIVPIVNTRSNHNTYSEGMADLIADFVPGRQGLTETDATAWRDELNDLSRNGDYFFSLNRLPVPGRQSADSIWLGMRSWWHGARLNRGTT
jgi:hypothetical protein